MTASESEDDKQAASAWRRMRETLAAASSGLENVNLDSLDRYGGLDAACESAKQRREQREQRGYTPGSNSVNLDDGPGATSSTPHGCIDCRNLLGLLRTARELNRAVPSIIDVIATTLSTLLHTLSIDHLRGRQDSAFDLSADPSGVGISKAGDADDESRGRGKSSRDDDDVGDGAASQTGRSGPTGSSLSTDDGAAAVASRAQDRRRSLLLILRLLGERALLQP